jgi:effector-binding domain-containing protein
MAYEVRLTASAGEPTAVVAASTTWEEFPGRWRSMLDEVWAFLRGPGAGLRGDGHNVMLYLDDVPNVEVGVQVSGPFPASGRVVPSTLPAGEAAMTVHRGPPERIDAAHRAVLDWCAAHGRRVAGPRWEIYGDWGDDPAAFETTVYWLLRPPGA